MKKRPGLNHFFKKKTIGHRRPLLAYFRLPESIVYQSSIVQVPIILVLTALEMSIVIGLNSPNVFRRKSSENCCSTMLSWYQ